MNQEFLEEEDNIILNDTLREFGVDYGDDIDLNGFVRFWNRGSVQMDGEFSLRGMSALAEAMRRMEKAHVQNIPPQ